MLHAALAIPSVISRSSCLQTCLPDGLGCPGGSNVCQGTSLRQTLASQGCRSRGTPSGR